LELGVNWGGDKKKQKKKQLWAWWGGKKATKRGACPWVSWPRDFPKMVHENREKRPQKGGNLKKGKKI